MTHQTYAYRLITVDNAVPQNASVPFDLTVAVNAAPIANAGSDQLAGAGTQVTLNGYSSWDPDGDPLTYQWTQLGGPAVSLSGSTSAIATFTAPTVTSMTTLTFRLTDSDGQASAYDDVNVTVMAPISTSGNFSCN